MTFLSVKFLVIIFRTEKIKRLFPLRVIHPSLRIGLSSIMPQYHIPVFVSRDFTNPQECVNEAFKKHIHLIQNEGYSYWAGPGTVPGTFSYRIEKLTTVFGPEKPKK